MKSILLLTFLQICSLVSHSQESFPLYETIPNAKPGKDQELTTVRDEKHFNISKISRPTLTVYLPPAGKATGAAIVICPGGGYLNNAAGHEGLEVAKTVTQWGLTAFVLKYRIPNDTTMVNKEIGPLQDAQRALQIVRERAAEWKIAPDKVGIMGFSAGGHLASTAGTHFNKAVIDNPKKTNLRPDFMILIYPVINLSDSLTHMGSRKQLLGNNPAPEKIAEYSNDLRVTANTPPTFLVHAGDDGSVKVQNSVLFYLALQKNKVPAELHIYPKGGHGFGMDNPTTTDQWVDRMKNWLIGLGYLK